jgi:hypothetical protein
VKCTTHNGDSRIEAIEHAVAYNPTSKSNLKTSSPKHVRIAKTKSSGTTLKGREKANVVNTVTASKAVSQEDKESSSDKEEQKHSDPAHCNRLIGDKQIALSTKPVVLLHNIASNNSSSLHSSSMPKSPCRNSDSLLSPSIQDRAVIAVTDPVAFNSVPNAEVHKASNTIPSAPAINLAEPHPVSPAIDIISSGEDVSSSEVAYDESADLPADTATVESTIKCFSMLSHLVHGRKDNELDCTGKNRLLSNVEKSGSACGDTSESMSCEVSYVSREVTQILEHNEVSDMEISACHVTVNDITMSEHEAEKIASECVKTKQDGEPDSSHQTHCNSDYTSGSWTREEDKIILQMFQLDCSTEQTFVKISEQLPLRTMNEVNGL